MADFEDGSIEALAASIEQREAAGHDPKAGSTDALDAPTEIQPQAVAEESADVEEPVVETAEADASEIVTPDPAPAPKPLLATPEVAPKQDVQPPASTPEVNSALSQTLERANAVFQQLEASLQGKFADLKSPADVLQLMRTDPERYNDFIYAQQEYQQARAANAQVQTEAKRAYEQAETQRLHKALPDLADSEKGKALADKLRAYAKSQGIPDTRQARNADEVIRLHREMTLADENATLKAEKSAQAAALAKASEKAATAPPVQKPGAARISGNTKIQELEDRFSRTGRPEDLALVFAARGG